MTREDLKVYKNNQEWIKERFEYIEELRTNIEKITTVLSDMPKGSRKVQDSMAEKISQLQDSLGELMDRVVEADNRQKEILQQLDQVEQPYKLILDKVYIQGKNLVLVAGEMNYSYRDICRKHGIALNKFDNL
jgi:DNA-directed RNA polymerase specialized sigma subunit